MASGNAVAPFRMCDNDPPTHSSPITEPPMSSSAQPSSRAHRPNFSGTRLVCNDKKLTVFSSLLPRKPQTATKRVKPLTLFVCGRGKTEKPTPLSLSPRMALRRRKFAHLRENLNPFSEAWLSRKRSPD
jgi:hypothetical protein